LRDVVNTLVSWLEDDLLEVVDEVKEVVDGERDVVGVISTEELVIAVVEDMVEVAKEVVVVVDVEQFPPGTFNCCPSRSLSQSRPGLTPLSVSKFVLNLAAML
jgi:hypothetical protein